MRYVLGLIILLPIRLRRTRIIVAAYSYSDMACTMYLLGLLLVSGFALKWSKNS